MVCSFYSTIHVFFLHQALNICLDCDFVGFLPFISLFIYIKFLHPVLYLTSTPYFIQHECISAVKWSDLETMTLQPWEEYSQQKEQQCTSGFLHCCEKCILQDWQSFACCIYHTEVKIWLQSWVSRRSFLLFCCCSLAKRGKEWMF